MLLQTNSYIVPKDRRSEHARLLRKFRTTLLRLGCEHFEVYEQVGPQWASGEATGRFVQIMRFRDRAQQLQVQDGEKNDPVAQELIQEFCALINFPYQQQQGLFAVGFYNSALPVAPAKSQGSRPAAAVETDSPQPEPGNAVELPASEEQGSSLLDFDAIMPNQPQPLRLTSNAETDSPSNGEHALEEAAPLTDADRDAILGELTGDDSSEESQRLKKAEG